MQYAKHVYFCYFPVFLNLSNRFYLQSILDQFFIICNLISNGAFYITESTNVAVGPLPVVIAEVQEPGLKEYVFHAKMD